MPKKLYRRPWLAVAILPAAVTLHFFWPRQAHLRKFNPAAVGKLETAMWRHYYRREYLALFRGLYSLSRYDKTPGEYGAVVAQVTQELYGVSNAEVTQAALLRAEMMRYRDERRNGRMQAQDWAHIEKVLVQSYQLLKAGINTR